MNKRVEHTLQGLANALTTNETLTAEPAVQVANGITEATVQGYRDMDRVMPSGWREQRGPDFTLTDFIDPDVARLLLAVETKRRPPRETDVPSPPAGFVPPAIARRFVVHVK